MKKHSLWMLLATLVATNSFANMPSDEELALSALEAATLSGDSRAIDHLVRQSHERIHQSALLPQLGDDRHYVVIVLNQGLLAGELASFVEEFGLELASIEAKHPFGSKGSVYTMSIGTAGLYMRYGSLTERILMGIGSEKVAVTAFSVSDDPEERELARSILTPYIYIYRFDAIGRIKQIRSLIESPLVTAVLLKDRAQLADFDLTVQHFSRFRPTTRPERGVFHPGNLPPGTDPDSVIWLAPPNANQP